jgi:hypothetical protein
MTELRPVGHRRPTASSAREANGIDRSRDRGEQILSGGHPEALTIGKLVVVHGATEKISEQTIAASHERGGSHVQTTGRSVIENLSRHSEGVSGSSRIIQEAASADRRAPRDPMHPRSSTAAGSALEPHWRDSADKCEYP